jgi:hypothetical protein
MDYHADRFEDHSLMIFNAKEQLIAVLAANQTLEHEIYSHQGLSYGGLLHKASLKSLIIKDIFIAIAKYYLTLDFKVLYLKLVPEIYHTTKQNYIKYLLHQSGAQLIKQDLSSVISTKENINYDSNRKRNLKLAQKNQLELCDSWLNIDAFYNELSHMLETRYNKKPVHNLAELNYLKQFFPEQIKLYSSHQDCKLLAGIITYHTNQCLHFQYICNSEQGRILGALDFCIHQVILKYNSKVAYIDFGISTEEAGKILNEGLHTQKEGFGARSEIFETYRLDLELLLT